MAVSRRKLKPGWTWVKFGDVVRLSTERCADPLGAGLDRYVGLEHIEPEDLRIRRWGSVAEGITFTNRFRPGQVLFGKRRAYQRKVAVADFEGVCSGDIYVLENRDPATLLPDLLPFICQTDGFYEHAVGTSAGSLSPRTNWTQLAQYEFALPPLDEQRRVIRLLQAIEVTRESYSGAIEQCDLLEQALTQEILATQVEQTALNSVLVETAYGCSIRSSSEKRGHAILGIPNVLRSELDLSNLRWVDLSTKEVARYSVEPGDILMVRTNGNPDYVGRCVVIPQLPTKMVYASYLIRLRLDRSKATPEYVAAMLNTPAIRRRMRGDIRSSAGNYNINTQGIRRQSVPLPNLALQRQIVDQLNVLKSSATRLDVRNNELIALKTASLIEVL